ncbi:MAG: methyl-accepting chemotaxis protein, partial [Treponema sp.]|nr:methyl-accepting chemotaxis protein [Treponema sp.]
MKIKIKLSIIVIAIVVAVAGTIAVILLRQASNISMDLSIRGINFLTEQQVSYWEGRYTGYFQVLRTVSAVMEDYESVPVDERRTRFNDMLLSTIKSQPNFVRVFTVWKPNSIDGRDNRNVGKPGSSATGQYTMTWGRDNGPIVEYPNLVTEKIMTKVNGPDAQKEWIENPTVFKVNGEDTYIVRLGVPIISSRTKEVVGNVGCILNIGATQATVQELIDNNDEISSMSIYADDGTVVASLVPDRIGKNLKEAETIYGKYTDEALQSVVAGKPFECSSYSEVLKTNVEIILKTIKIGNADASWAVMIASAESYILKEVNQMTRFAIILAAVAIVLSVVIVYFVLDSTTKPIVTVAETLKDISEGEGDLTRSIAVSSKDEIGDLALYFNNTLNKIKNLVLLIKKQAGVLSEIGTDLSSNMTETAAAINQITA